MSTVLGTKHVRLLQDEIAKCAVLAAMAVNADVSRAAHARETLFRELLASVTSGFPALLG